MQSGSEQLKDWIGRRKFNQVEAADYLGLDYSVMSLLVNGLRNPGLPTAIVIERKTGIPVEAWTVTRIGELGERMGLPSGKRRHCKA